MKSKAALQKIRTILLSSVLYTGLVACSGAQSYGEAASESSSMAAKAPSLDSSVSTKSKAENFSESSKVATAPRMVSRRVDLQLRVKKLDTAERQVRQLTAQLQGYVEAANSSDLASDQPQMSMTLRIPVKQFDRAIEGIESFGTRLGKSITSDDVTAQVVDFDARMRTRRAQEDSLRQTLTQARKLADIIVLQDKLTEVREQIESMTGQRNALADQAAMSTVTVSMSQHIEPLKGDKDPDWIGQTFGESLASLAALARGVLSLLIRALVFSPIWLPIVWLLWRAIKGQKPVA